MQYATYIHLTYIYIYILRLRPCRRPPWMQGAAGCLATKMGVYLYLRLSFWRPSGCFLGAWGTILVIMGSRGTPNGHTEGQMSIFIDFRIHFGSLLGPTLGTIGWFSVILDVKVGDSFQIYFLCDPGMEMMPEFRGWMCLNHGKFNGFWRISLLSPIQRFGWF